MIKKTIIFFILIFLIGLDAFAKQQNVKQLRLLCKNDNPTACFNLADIDTLYVHGSDEKTVRLAEQYCKKACSLGHGTACFTLADAYDAGQSVSEEQKNIIRYYEKGCEYGNSDACISLANRADFSNDETKNLEVVKILRKGCELKDSGSCTRLSDYYLSFENFSESYKYAQMACDYSDPKGCKQVAVLLKNKKVAMLNPQDAELYFKKSFKLFSNRCSGAGARGYACTETGILYYQGLGTAQNYFKAKQYFHKSCDQVNGAKYFDARSCQQLGLIYQNGHGVKRDIKQAIHYFIYGCSEDAESCHLAGTIFQEYGQNDLAEKYFKNACELDSEKHCRKK